MISGNASQGTSLEDLRLMDRGLHPVIFTGSEDDAPPTQAKYALIRLLHEWPDDEGFAFLAFRLVDGNRGDIYVCTNPPDAAPRVEQLLDRLAVPRFCQSGSVYSHDCMGVFDLWEYVHELLSARVVTDLNTAVYRAILSAARAGLINWRLLKAYMLEDWVDDFNPLSFCPVDFEARACELGGEYDDVPLGVGRIPENREYLALLELFLHAYNQAMLAAGYFELK